MFSECETGAAAFDKYSNSHKWGATKARNAVTLEKCFAFCLERPPSECAGFDFNKGTDCWIHEHSTIGGLLFSSTTSDFYKRKLCGEYSENLDLYYAFRALLLIIWEGFEAKR